MISLKCGRQNCNSMIYAIGKNYCLKYSLNYNRNDINKIIFY